MSVGNASWLRIRLVVEGHGGAADNEGPSDLDQLDALAMLVGRSHGCGWRGPEKVMMSNSEILKIACASPVGEKVRSAPRE